MRGSKNKLNKIWARFKKKNVLLLALIILLTIVFIGFIFWARKTGRFGFRAEINCPAQTICNQATVTYNDSQGQSREVNSNIVMVQIDSSPTASPTITSSGATQQVTVVIALPTFNQDYSTNNVNLKVFSSGSQAVLIEKNNLATNSLGQQQVVLEGLTVGQSYDFQIDISRYLSKSLKNIVYNSGMNLDFGTLKGGDLNDDNIVNGLDFTYLVNKWTQNDAIADINKDGTVNNADFGVIDANWFAQGT